MKYTLVQDVHPLRSVLRIDRIYKMFQAMNQENSQYRKSPQGIYDLDTRIFIE